MSKPDANIKIGADATAATNTFADLSQTVHKGLDGIGKAYMGVLGVMAAGRGVADAFWNLRHLRRSLRDARVYVQAQNGQRSVLVRRDASAETWAKAEALIYEVRSTK